MNCRQDNTGPPTYLRLEALFVLSITLGLRPGELRKLTWDHVDLTRGVVHVWRSASKTSDTKTPKSKRSLILPKRAIVALQAHKARQDAERREAGDAWHASNLVCCHENGTMYTSDAPANLSSCSVFGIDRTPNRRQTTIVDTEALLVDALAQLGVQARQSVGVPDEGIDLVIDPGETLIQVKRRALVTDEVARRLLAERPGQPESVLLVVGDRVTEAARRLLVQNRAGYYDLRGRLVLRSPNVVIDADVEPIPGRTERTHALSGNAGLEVATALLIEPTAGVGVRGLARRLGRSASTVSEVLSALREGGLVDDRHRVAGTELFWQVADRWHGERTYLAQLPMPGGDAAITQPLRLGLDNAENTVGWALTDSAAAVLYGAPVAVRTGQILDFYVPDQLVMRRATTLLGAASSREQARCAVRIAPVRAACDHRVALEANPFEWPLAHPVFVALDLAQDAGRGREILDAWTPSERWTRVW